MNEYGEQRNKNENRAKCMGGGDIWHHIVDQE